MPETSPAPITVLVSLSQPLDAEAYAARINQEPGWRARLPHDAAAAWDVALADRCHGEGAGDCVAAVLLVAGGDPACACCRTITRDTGWRPLLKTLATAAGRDEADAPDDGLDRLTRRELDVLRLVGLGKSVAQCAEALGVSPSTVGNHKYRLMRKLKVRSSLQLLRIAVRNGLADLD